MKYPAMSYVNSPCLPTASVLTLMDAGFIFRPGLRYNTGIVALGPGRRETL